MNPSWTTNHKLSVYRLDIELPSLITTEQRMSLIFAIGINFKCK